MDTDRCKKEAVNPLSYFSNYFQYLGSMVSSLRMYSIYRSLLYNIQLKAPLMFKLSIDIIYPRRACYATQTLKVIKEIAKRVNRLFFTPICVYNSSPYASMASCIYSATIFSSILPSVFLRATGRQLPSKKQSFLFTFWRITVIISL